MTQYFTEKEVDTVLHFFLGADGPDSLNAARGLNYLNFLQEHFAEEEVYHLVTGTPGMPRPFLRAYRGLARGRITQEEMATHLEELSTRLTQRFFQKHIMIEDRERIRFLLPQETGVPQTLQYNLETFFEDAGFIDEAEEKASAIMRAAKDKKYGMHDMYKVAFAISDSFLKKQVSEYVLRNGAEPSSDEDIVSLRVAAVKQAANTIGISGSFTEEDFGLIKRRIEQEEGSREAVEKTLESLVFAFAE